MRWIRVEDPSAVTACRNAGVALATKLRFPASRSDQLALAVTEAASNLHKHAQQGALLVAISRDGAEPGIDLVTVDSGPGLASVTAALRDGHSTAGSLGIGLGAIRRLADFCDLYSVLGHGSALVAHFLPTTTTAAEPRRADLAVGAYAGLIRPVAGEIESGDQFAAVRHDGVITAVLCDGLGHGPLAAKASAECVASVLDDPTAEPAVLMERAHRRMSHTRGGAAGIVRLAGRTAIFSGLGNIAATVLHNGGRKGMISVPGIAGHQARAIRQFEHEVPDGAAVILHSDGISSRWDPGALTGLELKAPLVIAAALLAEAGINRDDAGILVVKP